MKRFIPLLLVIGFLAVSVGDAKAQLLAPRVVVSSPSTVYYPAPYYSNSYYSPSYSSSSYSPYYGSSYYSPYYGSSYYYAPSTSYYTTPYRTYSSPGYYYSSPSYYSYPSGSMYFRAPVVGGYSIGW